MKEEDVLTAYGSLMAKRLIKVDAEKDDLGKIRERVSLDNFYNEIRSDYKKNEKKETKDDIYQVFEREFGRTLSTMDYEIINAWIDGGYSEELIIAALREAVYNGVTNLRYIDKILYEWQKKGLKTREDIERNRKEYKQERSKEEKPEIFEYNWLEDE